MESYDISVVVLTYNPIKEKLLNTLESIITQQDINIQIVLSDDGSKNNLFNIAKDYLESNHFYNYKLTESASNQGTVKNVLQGVNACDSTFVKLTSPGDCLIGTRTLTDWLNQFTLSNKQWSFCDIICYYKDDQNHPHIESQLAHPNIIAPYLHDNTKQCRSNYLINDDLVVGAATLCRKDTLIQYLSLIENHVKFAEDNIYRIMMFDNITPYYHPHNVVLYEVGSGVSTSSNAIWEERLTNDWNATNEIIRQRKKSPDKYQAVLAKALILKKLPFYKRVFYPFYDLSRLVFNYQVKQNSRYTSSHADISLKF